MHPRPINQLETYNQKGAQELERNSHVRGGRENRVEKGMKRIDEETEEDR
jgi:hypothetical protein